MWQGTDGGGGVLISGGEATTGTGGSLDIVSGISTSSTSGTVLLRSSPSLKCTLVDSPSFVQITLFICSIATQILLASTGAVTIITGTTNCGAR